MNVPATDAVCVAEPLIVSAPVHAEPFAPPPPALQLVALGSFHVSMKLVPMAGVEVDASSVTPGGSIVTVTLAVPGGLVVSMPGHERVMTTSPLKLAGGVNWRVPVTFIGPNKKAELLGTLLPVQKVVPEDDQVMVNGVPAANRLALVVSVTRGGGGASTVMVVLTVTVSTGVVLLTHVNSGWNTPDVTGSNT